MVSLRVAPLLTVALLLAPGCAHHEILEYGAGGDGICQLDRQEIVLSEFVGAERTSRIRVRNVGDGPLLANVPTSVADGAFTIVGGGVFELEAGGFRELTVVFSPTSVGVTETTVDLLPCHSVRFEGTGMDPPVCFIDDTTLDFGTFSAGDPCPERTFTIRNDGVGPLEGIVTSPCDDFVIIGAAEYSLATGEDFDVTVQYVPRAVGPSTCELDLGAPFFCGPVECQGTSLDPPSTIVTSETGVRLQFGAVLADGPGGVSAARQFTVENVGSTPVDVDPVFASAAPDFDIQPSGSVSLPAGGSATYTVTYDPANTLAGYGDRSLSIVGLGGCALGVEATGQVSFAFHVNPLMQTYCQPCHNRSYSSVVALSDLSSPPSSPILVVPATGVGHSSGGIIGAWAPSGTPYKTTLAWVEQACPF